METQDVTTYRLAYLDQRVTLCADCAETYSATLGPVEHGRHTGVCEECEKWEQGEYNSVGLK